VLLSTHGPELLEGCQALLARHAYEIERLIAPYDEPEIRNLVAVPTESSNVGGRVDHQ
jgi:hypothetical protein